ncbi:MAG: biotin--[acetyl-CoA-carboxylase] ligase [Rickettsiaceae bacterium]|nr:biotin--[acetyl-CoA-carboxylase] ligase [Rickettsiaceae bacterium]
MNFSWLMQYDLLTFASLDSTNTEALKLARAGVKGNYVIVAKDQKGGRGRNGKSWTNAPGNLYCSILLEVNLPLKTLPQISFITANAVYESIELLKNKSNSPAKIALKWPNDVFIHGKKVAGILLESLNYSKKQYIVIGIGVNVVSIPKINNYPVTSLIKEGIPVQNANEFLNILICKFDNLFNSWKKEPNFTDIRAAWLSRALNLNEKITIMDGGNKVAGIFRDIDMNGSLLLELSDGEIKKFHAGEIITEQI